MERIARVCEEIHAFAGTAERTGTKVELRSIASGQRRCTSLRDLVRKYKLYGDGLFYLRSASGRAARNRSGSTM